MEKFRPWSPALNIIRRDKATQPPPKYTNLKAALIHATSIAHHSPSPSPEEAKEEEEANRSQVAEDSAPHPQRGLSKRRQRRQERFVRKREQKEQIKQSGNTPFPPDSLLLFNATIYGSVVSLSSPYTWLVISGGKVHKIGSNIPPFYAFSDLTRTRNLQGKVVLPGLVDAHCHVYFTGKLRTTADFSECDSIEQFQSTLREYISSHPLPTSSSSASGASSPPRWYVGNRWEHDRLGRYPRAADVDAVASDHPVFCWRVCYHVAVVNTAALRLAGITRDSPNPPGGSIDRDEEGEPTGLLRETAAEAVVRLIVESAETKMSYVKRGLEEFLSYGVTFVQTNDEGCWPVYCQLADEGQLPIRVALTIQHKEMQMEGQPRAGESHGPLLSCHRIKLFADGALGAETAALSQPYVHRCAHPPSHTPQDGEADSNSHCGILIHTQAELTASVHSAHQQGYRIEMHVIGDRAASMAVQSFIDASIPPTSRPILTHCQVLSSSLLTSFATQNVIANIQPQFLTTDARWLNDRLPPSLLTFAYAWKSLLNGGVRCAGGSDSPIEEPSPWEGMHAAVYRPMRQYKEMKGDREGWERVRGGGGGEAAMMEWYGGVGRRRSGSI